MADPNAPASPDPFAHFDVAPPQAIPQPQPSEQPAAAQPVVANDNAPVGEPNVEGAADPFAHFDVGPAPTSATGAFARGAEKAVLPAGGSLAGAGAGAEVGAAIGTFIAPGVGTTIGGVLGGIAGGIAGSHYAQQLQDWGVRKLSPGWRDALGFNPQEAEQDEKQHGAASFGGGLVPYLVTMHPSLEFRGAAGATSKILPEAATALQRLLAHPATAKVFGGGLMGGMEIGNEELSDEKIQWPKVAVATVFGTIFNRPNGIGEAITELGAHPTRTVLGRPHPTLAQAADLKVLGPGVTESVFQGTQEQAPQAAMTAQENARVEQSALGEPPEPDLHAVARQMEPELFGKYDDLLKRREIFAEHEVDGQTIPALSAHLAATNAEIETLGPEVAAAYRRAADTTGTGSVEAEPFPSIAHVLAAHESNPGAGAVSHETNQVEGPGPGIADGAGDREAGGPLPVPSADAAQRPQRTIGEQRAAIASDVSKKLIAAGRPPEEAAAAGQLIAARYVTRAGRFAGKLGTPAELYAREGAAIAGPNGRPQIPAGGEAPIVTKNVTGGPRGRAAADPRTWSLSEYLASKGGLKPDPELHAIYGGKKGPMVGGFGPLLQHGGLTLDEAVRAAKDGHYMFDNADVTGGEAKLTPRDLLDLLDNENRGNKVYRNDHVPAEKPINADEERASIIDALHKEIRNSTGDQNLKIDPALEDRVVEIIQKEGGHDVLAAYERAIMEDHDRYESLRDDRQQHESIPGWDAAEPATAPGLGGEPPGESGQTGVSSEGARETHGAEPRGAGEIHREPELAQSVEDYFQRVYHGAGYEPGAGGKPQATIPGTERLTDAELAQRKADEALKPKVAQKPMDSGLFGDSMDQKELFQRDQQQTPEFKNWFGESQAVDEHGAPLVVYHGSNRQFSEFKPTEGYRQDEDGHKYPVKSEVFFFGPDKETAQVYARNQVGVAKHLRGEKGGRPNVRPFYLSVKNPLDFIIDERAMRQIEDFSNELEGDEERDRYSVGWRDPNPLAGEYIYDVTGYHPQNWRDVQQALDDPKVVSFLKEQGYDGVRLSEEDGSEAWAVFDPAQIKSATKNTGEFDPENPNVYHQTARGKIRIAPDARPIITLMKDANASTIIHESGHQFLEELIKDANHPDAPPQLRDDAQTVRDWLGVTDDIKTKHHEKFARGFEQYLREGVAPSKELAGVFAKFRNWLLSIYQSIKGLGTEISPDIRSVFDRMLEMEPQRTIITPHERPVGGPLLHEIHTADAAHTEPHEAAAVFDRTKAEFDRYVAEPPKDVVLEVAPAIEKAEAEQAARAAPAAGTVAGAEAAGGAGPAPEVVPGGGRSVSVPASGGVGEGRGELGGSAGQAAAEGDGVSRPDNRAKLGEHPGTALAPGPADLFGAKQSPFTDRAGNIRVENLTTREDVAQAIRDSAAENNDFIGDRRGTITDGQVLELADALGMDAAQLNQRQLGQAFNAEQIMAARKLLIQSATTVSAAMKKAATGTDEDVMAYAQAKDRHQLIQAQVAGITAEAGRALRAFRSIAGQESAQATDQFIKQATGKTLFQLRAEAKLGAELQTPQQVSKFMQDADKHNFSRIVLEYWINGLISGPATHATYMVGNTLSAIMKVPESIASAAVARAASALGREGTGVHGGEAGALLRGFGRGIAPAIKAGIEAARTGITTQLPGEGPAQAPLPFQPGAELGQGAQFDEHATFHDAMASAFGLVRGMRDTVTSTAALLSAGGVPGEGGFSRVYSPTRATPNIAFRGVTVLPTGDIATLPSRGVAVIHSFFRSLVFSMEKNAMAYRQAANEGLSGTELHARVAELRQDPSQDMMNQAAAHEATETALMGKGSELTQRLAALTNTRIFGAPLLKFIDPFVRVSGNIIDQSLIRRTPVGLLTMLGPETELARDLTGKNGNVAQDKAIGRMMMGTALAVTFGSLAAQKMLSGSGPKDPKEANVWRMAGNQAHSVRIGDTWYQVNKLGPVGMLASLSADLYDVAHEAEEGDFTKAGAHLLHAITQNVLDESAMHGPAELLKAIETPDRYGESYIRNYLAAFVPYSVGLGQIARGADPWQRDTRTMIDTIRNKIPGHLDSYFGNELPVRRDVWGELVPSRQALGGAGISAIYEQRISSDPVNQALWKLGVFPGAVERKIHNVDLTPDQYDDFQRLSGRMAKMRIDKMVLSPQFQQQTPSVQHDWMTEVIKQSRESARQMVMIKNPEIIRQSLEAKQVKKQAINQRNVE